MHTYNLDHGKFKEENSEQWTCLLCPTDLSSTEEGWDSRLLIKEQNGRKIKRPHWLEQGTEEKSNPPSVQIRAFSVIWPRLAL